MRKTISLLKILISTTFGISKFKYKASKNPMEFLKMTGFILLIAFAVLPILIGYILYMISSYRLLSSYGEPGAIITTGVVLSCTMVLFFGFFYVISIYYFSNDMEHLVSLPLRPAQILGAKFSVVLLAEYLTEFPLVLPPVIIYGVGCGAGIVYWIYSIAAVLVIPVIPLCITSIIAIVVMRITNVGKKRDFYRIIGSIAGLIAILGVQFYIQNTAMNGDPEKITSILFSSGGIINIIARTFPPAAWVSQALIQYINVNGLLYLLLFIIVSAASFAVFEYLGEKLYFSGYVGSNEVAGVRKIISEERLIKETAFKGKVAAIFWREFRILNRVPIFFINNVLPVVLVPIIFIMLFFMSKNSGLNMLLEMAGTDRGKNIAALIIIGVGIFTSVANMTPSTSISREGAQFFVSKYIPVAPAMQILGKFYHSLLLMLTGDLLAVITLGAFVGLPAPVIFVCFVISGLASVSVIEIGLMIDLFRPLLVWDNPQKAVKQNMNGVLSMFLNMLWAGGILLIIGLTISNFIIACTVLTALFAVIGFILYKVLMVYGNKRYYTIEP